MRRGGGGAGRRATVERTRANYGGYANVVGVSLGSKFTSGRRVPDSECVQFFVSRKLPVGELGRPLPRHVFARTARGAVRRGRPLPTDVIELRNLEACCGAGSKVARVGGEGTVTLIFRDKSAARDRVFGVTCAHVVCDLADPRPADPTVVGGTDNCLFTGHTIGGACSVEGVLEYDIALIELSPPVPPPDDLGIAGESIPIRRIASREEIRLRDEYACAFPYSGGKRTTVESLPTALSGVNVSGTPVTIGNLIAGRGRAASGDSGGLVYHGDTAVGILVARADDDWLFFQPLVDALAHIKSLLGETFEVFATA